MKSLKLLKSIGISLLIVIGILFIAVVGYVVYMNLQYYRIDDNTKIAVENPSKKILKTGQEHSLVTYNIGFGAYNHDFSFFMDSGEMKDGTLVTGKNSKAKDKQTVINNTKGALSSVDSLDSDFYMFQEVDMKATRSHKVNQYAQLKTLGANYSLSFANNFHSAFLLYPLLDPHGAVDGGITTMSKYNISESIRKQYPVDPSFITKFTDLDRCFLVSRIPVDNGKELVLINSHMSAYDKGGKIREKQLAVLNSTLKQEYAKGNYVIVGGDFNHDIAHTKTVFETNQKVPEWVYEMNDENLADGFSFAIANNAAKIPTCRSTDMPYVKGQNYTVVIDGFIVSDNVSAVANNIDTDFMYSDHNPVMLKFKLS
ncbi:endonuclease [Paludicola sp. MB14-C6]|uniref:endonuclease n=1 Tax=Paludihabitans sp. MB14-C6 TaxID=3070656 RepID=UPI0027DE163F|nr:endonuclease [Paludicola sp. MB14-C6]WMJ21992.1 endonuclease [Paludicola sp. MB14-C6]